MTLSETRTRSPALNQVTEELSLMKTVRRRVMRSAGASTIGKRINLAAAIVLQLGPLCLLSLMSALPGERML